MCRLAAEPNKRTPHVLCTESTHPERGKFAAETSGVSRADTRRRCGRTPTAQRTQPRSRRPPTARAPRHSQPDLARPQRETQCCQPGPPTPLSSFTRETSPSDAPHPNQGPPGNPIKTPKRNPMENRIPEIEIGFGRIATLSDSEQAPCNVERPVEVVLVCCVSTLVTGRIVSKRRPTAQGERLPINQREHVLRPWAKDRHPALASAPHVISGGAAWADLELLAGGNRGNLPIDAPRSELVSRQVLDLKAAASWGFLPVGGDAFPALFSRRPGRAAGSRQRTHRYHSTSVRSPC